MKSRLSIDINKLYILFFSIFRKSRMKRFLDTCQPTPQTRILDVGGTAYNWTIIDIESKITLLNLSLPGDKQALLSNFTFVVGDGTNLQYADKEFDICFSNSVIEHLSTFEKQLLFAKEVCRVGKKVWVQTPARSFFFEPHWLAPFIHFFPKNIQRMLARNFTLRGWLLRPDQESINNFLAELRLLTYREMKELFPDCVIHVERFLGMPKAYIAFRK